MGIFKRLILKKRIKRWRQALDLERHVSVFNQLYARVDGFALSRASRLKSDAMEYVYGEIEFESFVALLDLCKTDKNTVFYDLGSGVGKAVLACAMVFEVKKSCGIELFPKLQRCALDQKKHLSSTPPYHAIALAIDFQQGDFLSGSFLDATLVFINATAFFGERWLAISKYLEQLAPGALVISTSKALASKAFKTIHQTTMAVSFGVVTAYIQERKERV